MNKLLELYQTLQPIVDLIELNKDKIYGIITEIEEDNSIPDYIWENAKEISESIMSLSYSGHTPINQLRRTVSDKI